MRAATPCCHSRVTRYPNARSTAIPKNTKMAEKFEARSAKPGMRSDFIDSPRAPGSIGQLPDATVSLPLEHVENPSDAVCFLGSPQNRRASAHRPGSCPDRHGRPGAEQPRSCAQEAPGPGKSPEE